MEEQETNREIQDSKTQDHVVIDYLLREVSAQTGEHVEESITEFSNILYEYTKEMKSRKRVILKIII